MKSQKKINQMSPMEHLKELRNRLFVCLISLLAVFLGFYVNRNAVMSMILGIGSKSGFNFIYKAPQALFMQEIRLCIVITIVVTLPIIVFQALAFVLPAFEVKLRTVAFPILLSYGLFLFGIFISYKYFIPLIMEFLCSFGSNLTNVSSIVNVEDYLGFFLGLLMAVGIIFEIPFVCGILCKIGIISSDIMRKGRRLVIVLAFVVAAIITPPDVLSQIFVAFPIILLYELSIVLCKIIERRRIRRNDI